MYRLLFIPLIPLCSTTTTAINILVLMADDLGYNDVSWHNLDMISPNLQTLAEDGIILENHCVSMCSASRSAILTGYYPIHIGIQRGVMQQPKPVGLYTDDALMSEYWRDFRYRTHIVGKWHLGFCQED